ncbi:hypothetical protein KKH39_02940 [Patescibacteria group bacterium]|nr:hypothetical protein [Patescibacteria group bacterium]
MKFIYNKEIDQQCHDRLSAHDSIFGEVKKTGSYPVTEEIVKQFNDKWTEEIDKYFVAGIYKIFKKSIPENFTVYINSTPYSMDIEDGISISASSINVMIMLVCHEANHYMFRKSDYKNKYFPNKDIEEAKEIFTVVNNIYFKDIMEKEDKAWSKFFEEREQFLQRWKDRFAG